MNASIIDLSEYRQQQLLQVEQIHDRWREPPMEEPPTEWPGVDPVKQVRALERKRETLKWAERLTYRAEMVVSDPDLDDVLAKIAEARSGLRWNARPRTPTKELNWRISECQKRLVFIERRINRWELAAARHYELAKHRSGRWAETFSGPTVLELVKPEKPTD